MLVCHSQIHVMMHDIQQVYYNGNSGWDQLQAAYDAGARRIKVCGDSEQVIGQVGVCQCRILSCKQSQ